MAVLGVIAFTSLMIGALMGMLMMTMRVTEHQERSARERRAADGAVVATINHLRLNTGAGPACGGISAAGLGFKVPFADVGAADDVSVTCEAAADDYGEPGGEVKLLGTGYAGSITNWKSAWASPLPAGIDPTLIHTGPEPLQFNGNVNSAAGAAVLRTDAGTPALDIKGKYLQGPIGIGGTGPGDCGVLGTSGAPTFIEAVAGMSCGDPSELSEAGPADYAIDETIPVLPVEDAVTHCPVGSVVSFSAGRYDHNAVKTLNRWFNGSCGDKTYHFPTGRYWFDANDADPATPPADRNALIIDDATSSFVFGEPNNWDATIGAGPSNFPGACNAGVTAGAPGASIVLSGRTEFQHRAGRLAVCPFFSGTEPYPAILQEDTQPNVITVLPSTGGDFLLTKDLDSHKVKTAGSVPIGCSVPAAGFDPSWCEAKRSFEVKLTSTSSSDPLKSVQLRISGEETNFPISVVQGRKVNFAITLAGQPAPTCTTGPLNGAIVGGQDTTFELLTSACKTAINNGSELDGATVKATLIYNYLYPGFCLLGSCPISPQTFEIYDVGVVADTWTGSATSPGHIEPASGWSNLANALADDSTADVHFKTVCGTPVCGPVKDALSVTNSFTLDGVKLTGPLDGDDDINSLGIIIKREGDQSKGVNVAVLSGSVELSLKTKDGLTCTQSFTGVPNTEGDTYYPMLDWGSSTCGEPAIALLPADLVGGRLLDDASVTVKVKLDCINVRGAWCGDPLVGVLDPSRLSYLEPVAIQYVGLMATTDSYKGPVTKARLSVDAKAGAPGSSANFFGSAYLPNSALDIFWGGEASGASIFGGELQLWSLGSQMAPGSNGDVVCCTKPEIEDHKVRVTAHIGGKSLLSVVVKLQGDRSEPEVLEWTQCGRNGACA